MTRALFVNSGILGHHTVAKLLREAADRISSVRAQHVNLSDDLTIGDRVIRRLLSIRLAPGRGFIANLDLRRWRQELNVGLLAARRIGQVERNGGFDVLHFHTQATAYASVKRMQRTPSIVSIDTTQRLASQEVSSPVARCSYRPSIAHDGYVFRAACAIVATSSWAANDLANVYPSCAGKLHVMPYPIDVDLFDEQWISERARIPHCGERVNGRVPAPVRVLFMGGDFHRKGGAELLAAWRNGRFGECAALDLVTDWPIAPDDLSPGVRQIRGIVPYTTAWFDLWRRADLFVMPTHNEAFGMVYQEAAAAGIPVVATNINAIPEIVEEGATGLLVRPGSVEELARALKTLIASAELRHSLGRSARTRIEAKASPSVYAANLGTLIEGLTKHHAQQTS